MTQHKHRQHEQEQAVNALLEAIYQRQQSLKQQRHYLKQAQRSLHRCAHSIQQPLPQPKTPRKSSALRSYLVVLVVIISVSAIYYWSQVNG